LSYDFDLLIIKIFLKKINIKIIITSFVFIIIGSLNIFMIMLAGIDSQTKVIKPYKNVLIFYNLKKQKEK
jgi:hypothetical protein